MRFKLTDVENDVVYKNRFPNLSWVEKPIELELKRMWKVAEQKFDQAMDDIKKHHTVESEKVFRDAAEEVMHISTKISYAKIYFCGIDDELSRGEASELRVDKMATEDPRNPRITLNSLDAWAKKQGYPLDWSCVVQSPSSPVEGVEEERDAPRLESLDAVQGTSSLVAGVEEAREAPLLNAKGGMSPTSVQSFLMTFAVLLEEFLTRTGRKFKSEGGENVSEAVLAQHLSSRSLPGARNNKYLDGQSVSVIELRIKEVIAASSASCKVGMSRTRAKHFLGTFAVLREEFLTFTELQCKSNGGEAVSEAMLAKHLSSKSLARKNNFPAEPDASLIEAQIQGVIEAAKAARSKAKQKK